MTTVYRCGECGHVYGEEAPPADARCLECGSLIRIQEESARKDPFEGQPTEGYLAEDVGPRQPTGPKRVEGPNDEALAADPGYPVTAPTFPVEFTIRQPGAWKQHLPDGRVILKLVGMTQTPQGAGPVLPALAVEFTAEGWEAFCAFVDKTPEQIMAESEQANRAAQEAARAEQVRRAIAVPGSARPR